MEANKVEWKIVLPLIEKLVEQGWKKKRSVLGEFEYVSPTGEHVLQSRDEVIDWFKSDKTDNSREENKNKANDQVYVSNLSSSVYNMTF